MAFPSGPSLNDTHTVGSNTWKWNGYAWDKQVAASGGGSGETADGVGQFNYSVTSGATNYPSASSNGDFIYNPDANTLLGNNLSIFKTDKDGVDFRDILTSIDSGSNFTVVFSVINSTVKNYLYCKDATYVASPGRLNADVYDTFPTSVTGGSGKVVSLEIIPTQDRVSAGEEFRLPGGATFDTVVTSFNGLTGAVTTDALVLDVAGISSSGGITVDGNLNVKNDFEIRNEGGSAIFEVAGSGQNVTIGDVDSAGNGNEIFIRDSHGIITLTASTAVTLNTDAVNLPYQLRHNSDTNTHFAFPANDEITLTTGGVTLAHLTDTFALQQGLSLDAAGITFPDGTFQNTVTRTDSYTGQIETASDKTYTLDPKVSTARTITGFYIKSASGTVTATLKNGSDTIKAASVSSSSGDQTSLANTSVAADAVLTLVLSSNSSALDVIFNVEYTSTS